MIEAAMDRAPSILATAPTFGDLLPHKCLSQCQRFWISEHATIGHGCFPIVIYIPAVLAALAFVSVLIRPALRKLVPRWFHNFAEEELAETSPAPDAPPFPHAKHWTPSAWRLLVLSLASAAFSGLASAGQQSPILLIPLVPALVSATIVAIDRPRVLPATVLALDLATVLVHSMASVALAGGPLLPSLWSLASVVWYMETILLLAAVWTMIRMPLRDPFFDSNTISAPFAVAAAGLRSPEDNFTLWNWMTVDWLAPLIGLAAARQINEEDVWSLPLTWQHGRMFVRLREMRGSLLWKVIIANARDLLLIPLFGILNVLLSMAEVIAMKQILGALRTDMRDTRAATAYAVVILFIRLAEAQLGVFLLWLQKRAYERSRGQLIVAIYEKGLRRKAFTFAGNHAIEGAAQSLDSTGSSTPSSDTLSVENVPTDETTPLLPANAKPPKPGFGLRISQLLFWRRNKAQPAPPPAEVPFVPASSGKVYDLIRYDAYEVSGRFWEFGDICMVPMRIGMSLYLIVTFLGPSALLGVAVVLATQAASGLVARVLTRLERRRRDISDDKLEITTNFIQAIRHLRWYDWQAKWLGRIIDARKRELLLFVATNSLSNLIYFFNYASAFFFPVVAFYGYTMLAGHQLDIDVAFPALDLFSTLSDAMRDVPNVITVWINASVSWGRISSFMDEPDKEGVHTESTVETDSVRPTGPLRIEMRDGSFSWPGTQHRTLSHVDVSFPVGLTAVCGKVGAGKSALLQAILGEMDQKSGELSVSDEMMGYCNQTPWLESLSIRDNILFSAPMNDSRYMQVLDACCLVPDLSGFTGGDLCHIGENGVGLSGGQRARVALARAIYSNSRILLLDDPIAALDHNTAETILTRLFKGSLLSGRIVVFVTHRTDLVLPYADQVLEVHHGRVRTIHSDNMEALRRIGRDQDEYEFKIADDAKDAVPEKFIKEEYRAHGAVVASIYWRYVKYGSFWVWAGLIFTMVVFRVSRVSYYYYIKMWGEAYGDVDAHMINTSSYMTVDGIMAATSTSWVDRIPEYLHLPNPAVDVRPWLGWFAALAALLVSFGGLSDVFIVLLLYVSGKRVFQDVMNAVSGATFRFYDVTPVGRLLNRLTSDLRAVDGAVVNEMQVLVWYGIGWISALIVIAATAPIFVVIAAVTSAGFVHLFLRFFPTAQSLRRLEMTRLSPLLSDFGILSDGLVTVRAFRAEPHFQSRTMRSVDKFQNMDHFYWTCQNWLQYRFDLVSAASTFLLSIIAIKSDLSNGTVAFVLTSAGGFVACTHRLCKSYGQLQMHFVSVERIVELVDTEQEPEGTIDPPASWPSGSDDVVFDDVTVRYAPHLDPALRNISVRIPAGSSVAITGRTGSGKSTFALALLGTILPDTDLGGDIFIGNIPISQANKHALRSRVSFVAQDPVLFAGTLRDNIDPQNEHSDSECAAILDRVLADSHLEGPNPDTGAPSSTEAKFTLSTRVDAGGRNLSQGQRQLVGLGRAILRRSAIVILDEATASIDARTAADIQNVLRTELVGSTVITIAHRAEAVVGAEYVLDMAQGKVKAFRKMESGESALTQ